MFHCIFILAVHRCSLQCLSYVLNESIVDWKECEAVLKLLHASFVDRERCEVVLKLLHVSFADEEGV